MKYLILSLSIVFFIACSNNHEGHEGHDHEGHDHGQHQHHDHDHGDQSSTDKPETPEDKLFAEVMELHDVAMAEMGTMRDLKTKLQAASETIKDEAETTAMIQQQIEDLTNADKGMMQWMGDYSNNVQPKLEGASTDSLMTWFSAEKVKVTKVKNDIMGSIKMAEATLKAYK